MRWLPIEGFVLPSELEQQLENPRAQRLSDFLSIRVVLSRYIPTSHIGKEEISSSSFYLTRMAAELQGLVDKFKVKPER
jgi:hypothetical protein